MKKFLQEAVTYFWIPLIMGLISYIFFQLRDVWLGVITLVALSTIYTMTRLYFLHKKWWLLIPLVAVAILSLGVLFLRAPAASLSLNGLEASGGTVSVSGGTVSVSPQAESNGEYVKNTQITLTAYPAAGYDWKSWAGTDGDSSNPTTVTMKGDRQVTVNFEPRFALIINNQLVIGSFITFAEGSVSVNPPPGSDGKYSGGTVVTLSAKANPGYDLAGWSGASSDSANPTTVTLSGATRNISVNFSQRFYLTVSNQLVIGASVVLPEGTVSVSPAPGDDGKYALGTKITITAVPKAGFDWGSWAGTASDGVNPATLTINSNKYVSVSFDLRFALSVNGKTPSGAVVSTTGGTINLSQKPGTDGLYGKNTVVSLTAVAADGYRFDHWNGDVSGTQATASVTMAANRGVNAVFIRVYSLSTTVSPEGGGTVSPASGAYDDGATVIVVATAADGYRFDHWSGDVNGTTATVSVTMNSAKSLTAVFVKNTLPAP